MRVALFRSSIRYGAAALAATAALVAAGCGSVSAGRHQSGAALADGNGVASKSPAQILAAASAALRGARGLEVEGHGVDNGRRLAVKITSGSSHALQASFSSGAQAAGIIVLPNAAYIRASRTYWTARGASPAVAPRLADRWLEVPPSDTGSLYSQLGMYTPTALAACLVHNEGTLTKAGTTSVDGQPAIVIKGAGDAPGSAPGTIAVATSGPPYPLRSTVTGPRRPGGTLTACNHGKGNNSVGTLTYSEFGHVPPIGPPPHPIPIGPTAAPGNTSSQPTSSATAAPMARTKAGDEQIARNAQLRLTDFPAGWVASGNASATSASGCQVINEAAAAASGHDQSPNFELAGGGDFAASDVYIYADTATASHWFGELSGSAARACVAHEIGKELANRAKPGVKIGAITSNSVTYITPPSVSGITEPPTKLEQAVTDVTIPLGKGSSAGELKIDEVIVRVDRGFAIFELGTLSTFDPTLAAKLGAAVDRRFIDGLDQTALG